MDAMLIPEHESPHGGRLGRHVEHDPRSRAFAVFESELGPIRVVNHRRYGVIFDQGQLGSCTGNALAGAVNTVPLHKSGARVLVEKDAVSIYEQATIIDSVPGQYPPDDTGSSGLAVCKVGVKLGYLTGYKHAFSIQQALAALTATPVITGVNWYSSFDEPDPEGMVSIGGEVRGGHEFEVHAILHVGATLAETIVEAENSWGTGWGYRGKFRFTAQTWAELLAQQGDVTVPMR
jgi:hypothetical protein